MNKIESFTELYEVVLFKNLDKELSKEVQKQEEKKPQPKPKKRVYRRKGSAFTKPKPRLHGFFIHRISPKKDFQRSMYKKKIIKSRV